MAKRIGLDTDTVIRCASQIANHEGLSAVTLARVAKALGIKPPSLYAHVNGLAGMRRAISLRAVRVLTQVLTQALTESISQASNPALSHALDTTSKAQNGLRAAAHAYRAFAKENPGFYDALLPAPKPSDDLELALAFREPVTILARLISDIGVPQDKLIHHIRAFRALLHGFVTLESAQGFGLPEDIDESFTLATNLAIDAYCRQLTADSDDLSSGPRKVV